MDRIENIKRWRVRENIKQVAEEEAKKEHLAKLTADIEALWDRAEKLIEVYNAGLEVGLPYPKDEIHERCFTSNSWSHYLGVGYYYVGMYFGNGTAFGNAKDNFKVRYFNAISIRGGGACNYDIDLCDGTLHFTGDAIPRLEKFVEEYNNFEKLFYDWIDEITKTTV